MRISHRYRFAFFSNPKTGSESVRAMLGPFSDIDNVTWETRTEENPFYAHIRPIEMRDLFAERGWDFDQYYRFTFVRNPWARLVSLYEMIHGYKRSASAVSRLATRAADLVAGRTPEPSVAGFQRWLRTVKPDGTGGGGAEHERWRRYGTYTIDAYAGDGQGRLLVNDVFRLEDMDEAVPRIIERLGLVVESARAPRVNARRHAPYSTYYDDASRMLVEQLYAGDIERFSYRFGE